MENLKEKITKEGKTLYPRALTKKQIETFIKKHSRKPEDEILELWSQKKEKHIKKWRNRYGMDDFYSFGAKEPSLLFEVFWSIESNLSYYINFEFKYEPPMRISGNGASETIIKDRIMGVITSQYSRFGCDISLQNIPQSGHLPLFSSSEAEHDWVLWKNIMSERYTIRRGKINKLIQDFKKGLIEDCDTLEKLEQKVKENAD